MYVLHCAEEKSSIVSRAGKIWRALENLDFVPYSRIRMSRESDKGAGPSDVGPGSLPSLIASQVGFPNALKDLDPRPYLCSQSRFMFETPDSRLLPEAEWGEVSVRLPKPEAPMAYSAKT